jgi:hypothetical protein
MTYDTVAGCIEIVEDTIRRLAQDKVETGLTSDVLAIPGWSNLPDLALQNIICSYDPPCTYLEFGTLCGRSLRAAASRNVGRFIGVDPFVAFDFVLRTADPDKFIKPSTDECRAILRESIAGQANIEFYEMDCMAYTPPAVVNVFLYDADHAVGPTRDGILHAAPSLDPGILLVDDFELSPTVSIGVIEAVARGRLQVHKSWFLSKEEGSNEGIYVAVISSSTAATV